MTCQEAVKNINALNAICGQKDFYDAELEKSLALAIEALENQIPKRLNKTKNHLYPLSCPNCDCGFMDDVDYDCCPSCGQAFLRRDAE